MDSSKSIIHEAAEKLRAQREVAGLAVLSLERPDSEVQQALRAAGATFERTWEQQWCHSDTCNHGSHDAGTDGQEWEVPASWLSAAQADVEDLLEVFPSLVEDDSVLAIIPAGETLAAIGYQASRSYAGRTYLVPARSAPGAAKPTAEVILRRTLDLVTRHIRSVEDCYDMCQRLGEERADLLLELSALREVRDALTA
jgi:hypothetical protein